MTSQKLFAVYLGGRAPKGNTELHDVVFVTGAAIEKTYEQLMDKWFGTPEGLHLDSWMELDIVDGYRITLNPEKQETDKKLFFVNLGAYSEGEFTEIHANKFLVAEAATEAKLRAKSELLTKWPGPAHTDDLYEVDCCIELGRMENFYINLTKTTETSTQKPDSSYHIIPKTVVENYMQQNTIKKITQHHSTLE
jgi:hypothetical protein